jgi:hypothetical protein
MEQKKSKETMALWTERRSWEEVRGLEETPDQ